MSKYEEEYEDDYTREPSAAGKSLKGYKVVIALMAVILVAVSGLYFYQSRQMRSEFDIERESLMGDMQALSDDYAGLQTTNDSLNYSIVLERERTDSVMQALAKERNVTRATIRRYEKELGTMRTVMAGYINTIDSLGKLNRRLIDENVGMRREITTERLRADMAEERAADADIKIRQGSKVIARDIRLVLLNRNDREVTRTGRAERIRTDFTLSANNLANPGSRAVYARITGPDGYVLANPQAATFDYEGDPLVYSATREVDYQNGDLPVGVYYSGKDLSAGNYRVEIFMDGLLIGSAETLLR
jgi:cell division protein ZapA (FtsZ GTPase activity inhibitor)